MLAVEEATTLLRNVHSAAHRPALKTSEFVPLSYYVKKYVLLSYYVKKYALLSYYV
jgi:hypothetical protein